MILFFSILVLIPFELLFLHFCREIDFVNETVRTLAGNGTKGSDYKGGGRGTAQARFHIREKKILSISHLFH